MTLSELSEAKALKAYRLATELVAALKDAATFNGLDLDDEIGQAENIQTNMASHLEDAQRENDAAWAVEERVFYGARQ